MITLIPFLELDRSYQLGKNARRKGIKQSENPYPKPIFGNRSFTNWHSWNRGWLASFNHNIVKK